MEIREMLKMLQLIEKKPHCVSEDIKELFKVVPSNPPSKEEKRVYLLIRSLEKKGWIRKLPISNMRPGGSHFTLELTSLGKGILEELIQLLCPRIPPKKNAKNTSENKRKIANRLLQSSDEISEVLDDLIQNIMQVFSLHLKNKDTIIIKQLHDMALGKIQKIILTILE